MKQATVGARLASKAGDTDLARRLGDMAEAALDDISLGIRQAERRGDIKDVGALSIARNWSFQLNETFTRAFGGVTK